MNKATGKIKVDYEFIVEKAAILLQTGVDLTDEEFKIYHSRKNLKKQFEDITYYMKKAEQIVEDLGRNFSW